MSFRTQIRSNNIGDGSVESEDLAGSLDASTGIFNTLIDNSILVNNNEQMIRVGFSVLDGALTLDGDLYIL